MLYCSYYHLQIIVHNPFIRKVKAQCFDTRESVAPAKFVRNLSICTNAAAAICQILRIQQDRGGPPFPMQVPAALSSALIMLVNIWGSKTSPQSAEAAHVMADVRICMSAIKQVEKSYNFVRKRRYEPASQV